MSVTHQLLNQIDVNEIQMDEAILIIKHFLKIHDEPVKINRSYTINEDLIIFVQMYEYPKTRNTKQKYNLGEQFFQDLFKNKHTQRSLESMRDRAKRFLQKLDIYDLREIVKHLQINGMKGFLHFENRVFKKPTLDDPFGMKRKKIHEPLMKKIKFYNKNESDQYLINNKDFVNKSSNLDNTILLQNDIYFSEDEQNKYDISQSILQVILKGYPQASQQDIQFFQDVIQDIRKKFNPDDNFLLETLEQLNGDVKDLILILTENKNNLLWTQDDDFLLKNAQSQDNIGFQLLQKYKKKEKILERLKYIDYVLPFDY